MFHVNSDVSVNFYNNILRLLRRRMSYIKIWTTTNYILIKLHFIFIYNINKLFKYVDKKLLFRKYEKPTYIVLEYYTLKYLPIEVSNNTTN